MLGWGTAGDMCQECAEAWATMVPIFTIVLLAICAWCNAVEKDLPPEMFKSDDINA